MSGVDILSAGFDRLLCRLEDQPLQVLTSGAGWPHVLPSPPCPSVWLPESHDRHEIAYVDRGVCVLTLNGTGFQVNEGGICIVAPGEEHYEAPATAGAPYTVIWVSYGYGMLLLHASLYPGAADRLEFASTHISLCVGSDPEALFGAITREAHGGKAYSRAVVRGYLLVLAGLIRRQLDDLTVTARAVRTHPDQVVRAVAAFVEEHCGSPDLGVAELAEHVALSPAYLTEYFRKQTGFSPYQYLLRTRIDRSRRLLVATDWPIAIVAREVGFSSPYHFSSTFKRLNGITPSQYRQQAQEMSHLGKAEPTDKP